MADKADPIVKVRALVAAFRVEHDKQTAILEELETLLSGGVGIAELLKQAEGTYAELWQGRYRSSYVWQYVKDRPLLKRLIKQLGMEELQNRMANYIRNPDPFFASKRHPFGLFSATVVQHAGEAKPAPELELSSDVVNCKHVPPCKTDREHTKRHTADMRGEERKADDEYFRSGTRYPGQ